MRYPIIEKTEIVFSDSEIIIKIKTIEDAMRFTNIDLYSIYSSKDTKDEIAYKKLKIIAQALNQFWEPNWDNPNEYKYYPYFTFLGGSGFRFFDSYYSDSYTTTAVGSRLCFKTRELAEYCGKNFFNLYKDYLLIS